MARIHVAIVRRPEAQALASGLKRIESRFYRNRRLPFGCVRPGDTIHFKVSGGGLIGSAQVNRVKEFTGLTPSQVNRLRREHQPLIRAAAGFWSARRRSKYGILIWLGPLSQPANELTVPRQYGGGWVVLTNK